MTTLINEIWKERWAYLFLLPALIPFFAFILWPLMAGLRLSLYDAQLVDRTFIGFGNFVELANDEAFRMAVRNTFFFVLGVVPVTVTLSLFLALVIFPMRSGAQGFFRMAFYLPVVASGVVLTMVWLYIFNPTYGLLNYLLSLIGIERIAWLGLIETALPSLAIVVISWTIGVPVILFIAGLAGIPESLYDAAQIDGANALQELWYVTLPLLRPTVLFILVTQTIGVFQVFVVVLLMTRGGPANSTQTIVYRIYETAFTFFRFGYASAMGVVLLLIVSIVAAAQFKLLGEEVQY